MSIRTFVFLLSVIFSIPNYAQFYKRAQLDSLEDQLQNQNGIERINNLLSTADAYLYFQLDTAQLYIDSAREEAVKQDYEWGICESFLIESFIQYRKGSEHLEKIKFIRGKCADWFEKNNFEKDALYAKLTRNTIVLYSEGIPIAFENAQKYLKQAQHFNDSKLLAKAWGQVASHKHPILNRDDYPESRDSALFYISKTKDSVDLVLKQLNGISNKTGGKIPEDELLKFERLAENWKNPYVDILLLKFRCYPFIIAGNVDSAQHYLEKINQLELQIGGRDLVVNRKRLLSITYQQAGDYHQMARVLLELAAENKKNGILVNLGNNFHRLGQAYFVLKEYDLAISYFLKSLELNEELQNEFLINSIKRSLADLYALTGENEKAHIYYTEAIDWALKERENIVIQIVLGNAYEGLAELYQEEKKYEQAQINYEYSSEELSYNVFRQISPKTGLLSMYLDMEDLQKADSLHNEMTISILKAAIPRSEQFHFEQGRLFIQQEKYRDAIKSLITFINFGTSNDITEDKKNAHYLLYKAHKALGQNSKALIYFEKYNEIEDSLTAGKVTENVQKIQADYEISLKESEIEKLQQEREISDLKLVQQEDRLALRQLYITLLIVAFLLLTALGYLLLRRIQLRKEKEKGELKTRLEIEALKSQQKAEIAEVKNSLYANISHEFKTPLTLIRVPLQEFRSKVADDDKTTFDSMLKNTDHLLEMLDELLGVSKMESGTVKLQTSTFNLAGLLSQIKLNFSPLFAEQEIQFNWTSELDQNYFHGDESKLNIVINNLLKNAFSHTPKQGWVKCSTELNDSLKIKVTNKGNQIDPKDLPHLFERYYRGSENSYPGSGIGLAWSKQIVELHSGTIEVDNSITGEVSFSVTIPLAQDLQEASGKRINTETKPANSEINPTVDSSIQDLPHVLVVEDNQEMRDLLKAVLKSEFRLDFAENGKTGEEMAIKLQPDLIVSDVMMPEKDGFEMLKSLKENFSSSHIPVILLTARGDSASRIAGLDQDADDYIGKPFDPSALKARINNLLRQRRKLHKLFSENPLLYSKEINCTPIDANFVDKARKILDHHYTNGDFSVSEFCRELALNRTSVNDKLRALANQSTASYIKNFRLEKALKMLIETDHSIAEVCTFNGFNNVQVFNKAFKQKFNCTPTAYRTEFKK